MSLLKKVVAAAAAAVMTFSLASCGSDTTWGADMDIAESLGKEPCKDCILK